MDDPTCPCEDGLPDPCTLCGEPADGICRLDTLIGWKHRAEKVEAERDTLAAQVAELEAESEVDEFDPYHTEPWIAADPDNRSEP